MSDLILYSYWRSSCSYRVRIALHLKGLDFEYRAVHLVKDGGEQKKADYLSLNPMGEVPCLVHKGHNLSQSMAIIEYLELFPNPSLLPTDPVDACRVRQICEHINTGIQPIQNLKVLQEIDRRFNVGGEGKAAWAGDWIARGFESLEKRVAQTAGTYCFGDTITAADLFLIPQVYNANRFSLDMDRYPTLKRINETCLEHDAFIKAEPSCQPDAPEPT